MKRVVLIGDSIRMGYQNVVKAELAGRAEFWEPESNGGTSQNVLNHLDEWAVRQRPDIIHINCGLHDLKKEFGAARSAVPPAEYEANLRTIFTRLRDETSSTVIWVATTPVNEAWHHARKPFDRFEADVVAYNAVATRVAREFGLEIDDLYAVVMAAGRDGLLSPDGVHFTPQGYSVLGKAVAKAIETHLEEA